MVKGKGLGKGLGAIFQTENSAINEEDKVVNISLESIKKNPYQPRTIFNEDKINELANSIKNNGLLQPIVVKKSINGYYIVSGERRYRAFQILEKKEIPAIVREMADKDMMIFGILENLQREDLSPLEEATSYKNLIDTMNYTQEELAEQLGKSRPYVANSLRLLKLPVEIKDKLEENIISVGHARALLSIKSKITMLEVCNKVVKDNMSVRALEDYLSKLKDKTVKKVKVKDIFIEEQENRLKKKLGTQVVIKQSKNKKGKIEISFNDNDEFERIVKMLKG